MRIARASWRARLGLSIRVAMSQSWGHSGVRVKPACRLLAGRVVAIVFVALRAPAQRGQRGAQLRQRGVRMKLSRTSIHSR